MQRGDKLRHAGHFNALRDDKADHRTDADHHQQHAGNFNLRAEDCRADGERHADDPVPNGAFRAFLIREAAKRQDEQDAGCDIDSRDDIANSSDLPSAGQLFWNIASMRRVTMKPPTMLMVAIRTEMPARIITIWLLDPTCSSAPRMMIPEMALVTAISGVCSA